LRVLTASENRPGGDLGMTDDREKALTVGGETEGGITSGYDMNDGVELKVAYSFFGSIYDEEEEQAVLAAMKQDSLTMGPQVQLFQHEFAAQFDVKHAFATSNCTTAMHTATQAFGIGPGDEVIITPNTFIATSLVVLKEGAKPVFADIDPRTYNIDPAQIEDKVTEKTRAIYVVHYAGLMCDMDPIMDIARRHGLYVMEDCAHAVGSTYKGRAAGAIGDIGCFSFHSLKNITTLGEGGMITTNNDDLADRIQRLRCMSMTTWNADQRVFQMGDFRMEKVAPTDYWIPSHFDVIDDDGKWGNNYRMTEAQAAVGRTQLRKVQMLIEKRRRNSHRLSDGLRGIKGITVPYESPDCRHAYHLYTLCVEREELGASRDEFMRVLYTEEGVQGILHYQPTYHFTGLRKLYDYPDRLCPNAEEFFYGRELNLPMHPRLTDEQIAMTIEGVRSAAEKVRR